MLRFYYNKKYKYTNRRIITGLENETVYTDKDYVNIDSPDTITGHIIYVVQDNEPMPTYIQDMSNGQLWYVSGITQLRTKKYQLSLLRDIISETPRLWKQEKAYINAGSARRGNFNEYKLWNLPFTNTKLSTSRLNINGPSSYFVFYVNETEDNGHEVDLQLNGTANASGSEQPIKEVTNLNAIPGYTDVIVPKTYLKSIDTRFRTVIKRVGYTNTYATSDQVSSLDVTTQNPTKSQTVTPGQDIVWNDIPPVPAELNRTLKYPASGSIDRWRINISTGLSNWNDYMAQQTPYNSLLTFINDWAGQIVKTTSDGKYYEIKMYETPQNDINYRIGNSDARSQRLVQELASAFDISASGMSYIGTAFLQADIIKSNIYFVAEEVTQDVITYEFKFPANTRKLSKSGVRCMNIVADGSGGIDNVRMEEILQLAQTNVLNGREGNNIAVAGQILDIQKLPFTVTTQLNKYKNIIINNSVITASIVEIDDLEFITNTTVYTSNKETTTVKLVSPTYKTQFEYRPYFNDNNTRIDVKATIRPYQSTIYLRPATTGLLLNDFNDKNCMIIEEDFSLTKVTNAWSEYVLQNKNFQSIFDRQIQGRELEQSWERRVEEAQAKADTWNAQNLSAEKAKTYTGNLPIVGNFVGMLGSAVPDSQYMEAARLDREYAEALRQESMSQARDMFKLQNGNLKSQPNIPKSITTFDVKSLDGIYFEVWGTNPTEQNAIRSYYENNGHRIDDYGTFEEYYNEFMRGYIVQSEHYTQPEIKEINVRLETGIYAEEGWDN